MAKAEDLGVDDVYEVLTITFGLKGDTNRGQFRIVCPVHEDHTPSCDIHLETGYWNCFSCPASGDLVDLGVCLTENIPFAFRGSKKPEEARRWNAGRAKIHHLLIPDNPDALTLSIKRRVSSARKAFRSSKAPKDRFVPIIPSESSYSTKIPQYLLDRGFTEKTIRRWNIRYVKRATLLKEDGKSFTITHAIGIPIYNRKKKLIGWCYRSTPKSDAWFRNVRYIYTPGITDTLSQLWFGLHIHRDAPEVTVVEGALDAIWCDQNGIPAVAILGSQVKQIPKIRQLMDFRRVTLFTDRDVAGASTAHHLGEALQARGVVVMVCLFLPWTFKRNLDEEGKPVPAGDAQDLCPFDIELTHAASRVPFQIWKNSL